LPGSHVVAVHFAVRVVEAGLKSVDSKGRPKFVITWKQAQDLALCISANANARFGVRLRPKSLFG